MRIKKIATAWGLMIAAVVVVLSGAVAPASAAPRAAGPTAAITVTPAASAPQLVVKRTTGGCSGGVRCWVHLNRAETWALAYASVPKPPRIVAKSPVLAAAYYALAYGHKVIARGWYKRGMCVTFLMSLVPWENNGLTGRRC